MCKFVPGMWLECGSREVWGLRLIAEFRTFFLPAGHPRGRRNIRGRAGRHHDVHSPVPRIFAAEAWSVPAIFLGRKRWILAAPAPYSASGGAGVRFRQAGVDNAPTGG